MQRILLVFLTVLFLFSLVETGRAQRVFPTPTPTPTPKPTPAPTPTETRGPCPNISVQAQGQMVRDGQPANFSANIELRSTGNPMTITWSISAGTITKGQYTPRIEVDTTGAGTLPEREIKAEIYVTGYAPDCVMQASGIVKIVPPAIKFGEFGEVAPDVVTKNLKTMSGVMTESLDNLSLVIYAGRNSDRGFTSTWAKRLKDELIANGVSIRRINAVDGGFREQPMFEFWLVPAGAEQPRPTPTVRREEIVYPKPPPKKP